MGTLYFSASLRPGIQQSHSRAVFVSNDVVWRAGAAMKKTGI